MVDWNNPSTSQTHSNELASTKARDESNAIMDYSADSNIPDGTIRWNSTSSRFEIWDTGSGSWGELDTEYAINVSNAVEADNLDGRDAGNSSGDVPISNGTLNSNLNADYLDGEHGAYYNDTPNGTKMLFYQASAPTGWTQDTSVNDRVLRVVSGSGGGSGGSWTISGLSAGRGTLSVDGHVLTEAEMPSHNHGGGNHNHSLDYFGGGNIAHQSGNNRIPQETSDANGSGSSSSAVNGSGSIISTDGGDSAHAHGLSGSPSVSQDGNWRPSHIDAIAATRSK